MRFVQPSPPNAIPAETAARRRWTAAAVTMVAAFVLYYSTLLPGVDFGDSGSIQTTVGEPLLTPRDGYPLYFAIGAAILKLTGGSPAHAMNLASAGEGAVACGLFVLVAAELTGSSAASVAGAMLWAVSYTFWSQCVTAEVYALHACFLLGSLLLALRWERQPSSSRLAAFFLCYALGFGNHLSMILLLPGFTIFLLATEGRRWRFPFSPAVVVLALAAAATGASPYLWNMRTLWLQPEPPRSLLAGIYTFWFDVTKADWRHTLVLNVPRSMLRDHLRMYWFDVRQQFGIGTVLIACLGAAALARNSLTRCMLLVLLFLAILGFAFSYNVGDSHVFYLPSHIVVALFAACGIGWAGRRTSRWSVTIPFLFLVYAGVRLYHDFPALDRSGDMRAERVLARFTSNLDDRRSILLVDLNWQIANGLSYFTKVVTPQVAAARMRDVLLYAPALIRDNTSSGRDVVLTEEAARILAGSYGPLFAWRPDSHRTTFQEAVERVPRGTRYALCVLKPTRDFRLDRADLDGALRILTGSPPALSTADYAVVAGLVGQPPALVAQAGDPFARTVDVGGVRTEIRMESWLSADTIRRMGFAHVIANRHHTLIAERGISFVAFDRQGNALSTAYFSNIYAELPRLVISRQ